MIGSAVHHDASSNGKAKASDADAAPSASGTAGDHVPAHSTHPETVNLGTSDVESDPALNDTQGQDWSDEGGATPAGAATNVDPRRD